MDYDGRYDDPKYINAFLADLKLTDEELAEAVNSEESEITEENKNKAVEQVPGSKNSSGINTPAATSPPAGTRAPPPTPEGIAWKATSLEHLPPISEDQGEERKNLVSARKESTTLPRLSPQARPFTPASAKSGDLDVEANTDVAPIIVAATRDPQNNEVPNYQSASDEHITDKPHTLSAPVSTQENKSSAGVNDQSVDASTVVSDGSDDDDSSINIVVDAPTTPDSIKSRKSFLVLAAPGKSSDSLNKIATQRSGMLQETAATPAAENEESREDAVYFSSWGAPSTRTAAPARVRKIILTNLPPSADFTLVQSLMHGGTIDEMLLSQSANGTTATASVVFVEPIACDAYFEAYPNGLEFRYKGIKHVAFVDKGGAPDVISSVLQTYLDFGASRVVKVSGADEDWSMRALYKIAGGGNGRRKVEAIVDSYCNDSRTITFRFTKIADAVSFRAGLVRHPEWEHADVQFAADPCKRATGIRVE